MFEPKRNEQFLQAIKIKLFKIVRKFSVQFFLQNIELWCRSLAPLTIGGPSSTSLETPGTQLPGRGPPPDPRLLRKMAGPGYPWLMGPGSRPRAQEAPMVMRCTWLPPRVAPLTLTLIPVTSLIRASPTSATSPGWPGGTHTASPPVTRSSAPPPGGRPRSPWDSPGCRCRSSLLKPRNQENQESRSPPSLMGFCLCK